MDAQPIQLDARGLEPPQPMMKILEALAALPAGTVLAANTDRQPMLLYPMLEQRGFTYETTQQSDGSHLTHIRHR
jgi:TusA-related sulfurtransferase